MRREMLRTREGYREMRDAVEMTLMAMKRKLLFIEKIQWNVWSCLNIYLSMTLCSLLKLGSVSVTLYYKWYAIEISQWKYLSQAVCRLLSFWEKHVVTEKCDLESGCREGLLQMLWREMHHIWSWRSILMKYAFYDLEEKLFEEKLSSSISMKSNLSSLITSKYHAFCENISPRAAAEKLSEANEEKTYSLSATSVGEMAMKLKISGLEIYRRRKYWNLASTELKCGCEKKTKQAGWKREEALSSEENVWRKCRRKKIAGAVKADNATNGGGLKGAKSCLKRRRAGCAFDISGRRRGGWWQHRRQAQAAMAIGMRRNWRREQNSAVRLAPRIAARRWRADISAALALSARAARAATSAWQATASRHC